MQSTGDRAGRDEWQAPLEADPTDAREQARDIGDGFDDSVDPEAPAAAPPRAGDLDLTAASEADLAEQLHEVAYDDDGER